MINGSKMWITNAEHAGVFLVFANVAPEKVNNDKTHVTLLLPPSVVSVRVSLLIIYMKKISHVWLAES